MHVGALVQDGHTTLNVPSGGLKWENKTYKVERSTVMKLLVLLNGHMLIELDLLILIRC